MSTKAVLDHHLQSFGAGNTEEILKDYTEESVLLTPDGPVRGLAALKGAFDSFFGSIFKPGTYDFAMDRLEVEGEVGYVAWHAKTSAGNVPLGTDTFLVRNGKIVVQTFAMHVAK